MEKLAPRILLVDDDSDIVELLEYNLTKEGYEVFGLTDPFLVVSTIDQFHPQIVIMDIMMPGKNGFQICSEIRNLENGKDLPVFFITNGEERLNHTALESGGDDFIQKFSGLRTLINRINLVLKKRLTISKRLKTLTVGPWTLDRDTMTVFSQPRKIKLDDYEFELLYFLAQNTKRSIPIRFLIDVVNGVDIFRSRFSIMQSLEVLSKKLGLGLIVFTSEHRVKLNA